MKRFIITLAACATLGLTSQALELTISPGELESSLTILSNTRDQTVTIKGEANSKDLGLLKNISAHVYTLDISDLIIPEQTIPDFFLFDTNVSRVELPEGTKKIGKCAFSATEVKVLDLPASVESIGDYAYADCKKLKVVTLNGNISMGKGIFKGCVKLDLVKFDPTPVIIPESMFEDCTALNFTIPSGVKELGSKSLRHTASKVANLQSVEKVGDYAYADCPRLESIEIDATRPIEFSKGVFFCDKELAEIPSWEGNIPDLFAAHTRVNLPLVLNNEIIGEAALANNNRIDSITLGSSVRVIKPHAFRNILTLVSINAKDLGTTVPEADPLSFSGLEGEDGRYPIDLQVDKGAADAWKAHPVWSLFNINEWNSVDESLAEDAAIRVVREGNAITATANMAISSFEVYSLNGMLLYSSEPDADHVTATDIDADAVVIARVKAGKSVKIVKLL